MAKRRNDIWVYVPKPGREAEATDKLKTWLRELDGQPGYLGGAIMSDAAKELVKGAIIVSLQFDSSESARALFARLKGHPIESDILPKFPPDQGWVLFEDKDHSHAEGGDDHHAVPLEERLEFNRGRGLFARLLHLHAEVEYEYQATGAPQTAAAHR